MRAKSFSVVVRRILPGMPVTRELGGMMVRSGTTAPAAMMELAPMWAPLRTVAPMPMRTLSSMVQPWTVALWPMLTPEPMRTGWRLRMPWRTAQSWMLVRAPMRMWLVSPRTTAFIQSEDWGPRWTSPMSWAEGSM